jgi:hypothetical protein
MVKISLPVFKCDSDRSIFLSRLYALPGLRNLTEEGAHLHLTFADDTAGDAYAILGEICHMWDAKLLASDGA